MKQQRKARLAAALLVVIAAGVFHQFRQPSSYWWLGLLCGMAAGSLIVAVRALHKPSTRIGY